MLTAEFIRVIGAVSPAGAVAGCAYLALTVIFIAGKRERRETDATITIDPRISGINLRVSNLINMMTRVRHDTIVLVDSDIEVAPGGYADAA